MYICRSRKGIYILYVYVDSITKSLFCTFLKDKYKNAIECTQLGPIQTGKSPKFLLVKSSQLAD